MTFSDWLWLATATYAIHMLEEFVLDWRDWARSIFHLAVDWPTFYVTNAIVVVLGIVAANLADAAPAIALAFPAVMLVNAVFFHIAPVVWTRGRYSPGVATAAVLFLPVGIACYVAAGNRGLLSASAVLVSAVIGVVLMAYPIVLLRIKDLPYFRQT
jgi:hypothetical protein